MTLHAHLYIELLVMVNWFERLFVVLCTVCRHGLSRTDYHIQYDPQLSFRKFVRERRGRTARQTAADLSSAYASVRGWSIQCHVQRKNYSSAVDSKWLLLMLLLAYKSSFLKMLIFIQVFILNQATDNVSLNLH